MPTKASPTARRPVRADDTESNNPDPYRSTHLPTRGEINTAQRPPRLIAPENNPLLQPRSSVIGTTNTERVATAMIVREDKLTDTVLAKIAHP